MTDWTILANLAAATADFDIRCCYNLYLLRDAEDDTVLISKRGLSLRDCVVDFVSSPEFSDTILLPVLIGDKALPDMVFETCPDHLRHWAVRLFGIDGDRYASRGGVLGQVLEVMTVAGLFDCPPQRLMFVARTLKSLSERGRGDGETYATALPPGSPQHDLRRRLGKTLLETLDADDADDAYISLVLIDPQACGKMLRRTANAFVEQGGDLLLAGLAMQVRAWTGQTQAAVALIAGSPLFDADWYAQRNPDVIQDGLTPVQHFASRGGLEGRDPSPFFSSDYYMVKAPDVRAAGKNPLVHFIEDGASEGRAAHPAFDADWYRRRYLGNDEAVVPIEHFVVQGRGRGLRPSPLFDVKRYLEFNEDIAASGIDPVRHYFEHGYHEKRRACEFAAAGEQLKIVVVCHVFYEELWPELSRRLTAIPQPFELVVTVGEDSTLGRTIRSKWPQARVVPTSNVGHDIGAFLRLLPGLLERGYDVVCKMHTKRGATEPNTWRYLALEGILGSSDLVRMIFKWFEEDPDLALVGPDALYLDGPHFIGPNGAGLSRLLADLGLDDDWRRTAWGFFAGSMFWARLSLLEPLAALDVDALFDGMSAARDGEIAHALERAIGFLAADAGKRIGLSDVSGFKARSELLVAKAPNVTVREELAETLPLRSRELGQRVAGLRKVSRRTWRIPSGGRPGVNLVGPVAAIHGLGVSARGFVEAIAAADLPLNTVDWVAGFERVGRTSATFPSAPTQPINIIHLNLDLMTSARLLDHPPLRDLVDPDRYNILVPYWELRTLDPAWSDTIHRFDEIWVASSFMADSIASVSAVPVRVVRPALPLPVLDGMRPGDSGDAISLPDDRVIFFYSADVGSILARKNPQTFWRSYAEEFSPEDGAFCVVKLHYLEKEDDLSREIRSLIASRPDMMLITDSLSPTAMRRLFERISCYVSPHRAEGLGLTMIEAMQLGKPVIATGASGEGDFIDSNTALVVSSTLVEVGEGAKPYSANATWADPDPTSLRQRMREVVDDPAAAAAIGRRGQARVEHLFSTDQASAAVQQEIRRIWRGGGGAH